MENDKIEVAELDLEQEAELASVGAEISGLAKKPELCVEDIFFGIRELRRRYKLDTAALLVKLKDTVPHGEFKMQVSKLPFSYSTATRYMREARQIEEDIPF